MAPAKTPVRLPSSVPGRIPASSSASQDSSSMSRCCGSMTAASRGEMPKNSGSNSSTRSRNPARTPTPRSDRSGGTSRTASPPSRRSRQNASGSGAPGKRQDSPITAMASPATASPGSMLIVSPFGVLAVLVEPAAGLLAQQAAFDHAQQERRGRVQGFLELLVQRRGDRRRGVQPDQVDDLQRPHRMRAAQHHALVDDLGGGQAGLHHPDRREQV